MAELKRQKHVRFAGGGPSTTKLPFLGPMSKLLASPRGAPRGTPRGKGFTPENTPRGKTTFPQGTPRSKPLPKDKEELLAEDLKEKVGLRSSSIHLHWDRRSGCHGPLPRNIHEVMSRR